MVVRDWLAAMLNDLTLCQRAGKNATTFMPCSKLMLEVLKIMKKEGYVSSFEVEEIKEGLKRVKIEIGKLNFCKAIKPRFYCKHDEFAKYVKRFLPARQFGVLIVSTSKGVMTHREAEAQHLGGSLLAYCY